MNIIKVKYIGPPNTKGSRVKLTDLTTGKSWFIPYDYNCANVVTMTENYINHTGLKLVDYIPAYDDCYYLIVEEVNP
jgi:hypothetical protein